MSTIANILSCKCPKCKKGNMFINKGNILLFRIPPMYDRCTECDFKFEMETGFFFGAMFVSYGLAAAQMIASLIIFWVFMDLSPLRVFLIITMTAFLLSTINYRISRSIWVYLFFKN